VDFGNGFQTCLGNAQILQGFSQVT
jgi:hypothetical protein